LNWFFAEERPFLVFVGAALVADTNLPVTLPVFWMMFSFMLLLTFCVVVWLFFAEDGIDEVKEPSE